MKENKFYPKMEREELILYCLEHCNTEKALFHKSMVAQMISYAGCPFEYNSPEKIMKKDNEWYSLHEDMSNLVNLALEFDS